MAVMAASAELVKIACENNASDKYFSMSYDDLLKAHGLKIIEQETCGSYQGDLVYLVERDGVRGVAVVGYGSCSGCDALQAAEPYDIAADDEAAVAEQLSDVQALADQIAAEVVWAQDGETLTNAVNRKMGGDSWWAYDGEVQAAVCKMLAVP